MIKKQGREETRAQIRHFLRNPRRELSERDRESSWDDEGLNLRRPNYFPPSLFFSLGMMDVVVAESATPLSYLLLMFPPLMAKEKKIHTLASGPRRFAFLREKKAKKEEGSFVEAPLSS